MNFDLKTASGNESIDRRIEIARRELLDLGLRNSLINYRLLRSRGVEVVDAVPKDVFQTLVLDSKSMSFSPVVDAAEDGASSESMIDAPSRRTPRRTNTLLQTAESAARLQSRLLSTFYAARTSMEEKGVNVLYLALGMLKWYEKDDSHEPHTAPLVLIPIELTRSSGLDRFQMRFNGEEIGANLSLETKFRSEFNVQLPAMPDAEDLDIEEYFSNVERALESQPRWQVDNRAVALGFFSFSKFLMYRDLDPSTWPADAQPAANRMLRALLSDGFNERSSEIGEDAFLDPYIENVETHQVVDADSSQVATILDVMRGRTLVIQGPPGTGKSQTITNLVAEAVGAGKTVLFVAEKMAALEVVKRRLDQVGLGDACLELHSHNVNKRTVVYELQRTLLLGQPQVSRLDIELATLDSRRARLNAYCNAVNTPVGQSLLKPYELYGHLLRIGRAENGNDWPRPMVHDIAKITPADFHRRTVIVEEFRDRVAAIGTPCKHTFWGVRKRVLMPSDLRALNGALTEILDNQSALKGSSAELATTLQLDRPITIRQVECLIAVLDHLATAPEADGISFVSTRWQTEFERLNTLFRTGQQWTELRDCHADLLLPEVWERNLQPLLDTLSAYQSKWWRAFSGTYRSAKKELMECCNGDAPESIEDQIKLVRDVMHSQELAVSIDSCRDLGSELYGPHWRGCTSDWTQLQSWSEWILALYDDMKAGNQPLGAASLLRMLGGPAGVNAARERLSETLATYQAGLTALQQILDFDAERRFGPGISLEECTFDEQHALVSTWRDEPARISEMTAYNVATDVCIQEDLKPIVALAQEWPDAGRGLTAVYERARYEALLEQAWLERPMLAQFDSGRHRQTIAKFRELDLLTFEHNRAQLAHAHWSRVPKYQAGGQVRILQREFEKRSRHLPIRRLMQDAGNAVQAIKPVFMMSPLSIASFIPPGSVSFDLVIFDEASQVKPVDAFGALLRGQQAVVVGDSRQLPPTSFFDNMTYTDDDDEDDATSDIESILGLFLAAGAPERSLRWHYRSRHESLIAVSNCEFYENRLVLFPSPDAAKEDSGLVFRHVPDSVYERPESDGDGSDAIDNRIQDRSERPAQTRSSGKPKSARAASINRKEAEVVAEAVMAHARTFPHLTLGVAAFSKAQAVAVRDRVDQLRQADPLSQGFFDEHPHEPFFVKNLENVQGDERDVIFISVGYGRDRYGKVSMNFGPLSYRGGERRLNVLITRARRRCEVFTNLTADDIKFERARSRGARAFQRFLKFAETGSLDLPSLTDRDFDSPFEESVHDALTGLGYQVDRQVGSAGFFIDLAVRDPRKPGRFLLAIECDGATYHSARSARDRDRLRQQVLEDLGWQVHRIWSTDWFRRPERELELLVQVIEAAIVRELVVTLEEPTVIENSIERVMTPEADRIDQKIPGYLMATPEVYTGGLDLHRVYLPQVASWIAAVVEVESPVHRAEVARRITEAAGLKRTGNRIRSTIDKGIRHAAQQDLVRVRGDFVWTADMQRPIVRDRGELPPLARTLKLVAPEEVDEAILHVVGASYGIELKDVVPFVCHLFGFQRITSEMRQLILPQIERLLADGRLVQQGIHLIVGEG